MNGYSNNGFTLLPPRLLEGLIVAPYAHLCIEWLCHTQKRYKDIQGATVNPFNTLGSRVEPSFITIIYS